MAFDSLFGVDETTTGASALETFASLDPRAGAPVCEAELAEPATRLMQAAIGEGMAAGVMVQLAGLIRAGMSLQGAIEAVFASNPAMAQWAPPGEAS
jgi:hypothetical protein